MKRTEGGMVGSLAMPVAVIAMAYTIAAVNLGIEFAIPVGIIGLIAAVIVLRGPLGKALARRLEGGPGPSPVALEEATGPLVAHIDELRGRMAELEERVDFAERMLTRQRETHQLGD